MTGSDNKASFWDHLDALRSVIIKVIIVWTVVSVVAFIFKEQLFDIVLAPKSDNFVTYRLIDIVCSRFSLEKPAPFMVELINTGLAQQFMIHVKAALCAGFMLAAPYALYELFMFVSPGLYSNERRYASRMVVWGYMMFITGILLSYFIIFPMTFRFLGTYQVASDVTNMISLDSYMSTLIMMCLWMGTLCELPVLSWLGARMGLLSDSFMSAYRRHAIVIILILAAVITPTTDIFTLLLVSVPICLLYEISILIVRKSGTGFQYKIQ